MTSSPRHNLFLLYYIYSEQTTSSLKADLGQEPHQLQHEQSLKIPPFGKGFLS